MDVYWLEQAAADVPADDAWLSAGETARLNSMRFAKRRADWRLGRWTAKRALAIHLRMAVEAETLAGIEIRAALSGAPEVFFSDRRAAISISISHCGGRAICAVAPSAAALGCDLEFVEERSYAFVTDYFTIREQALIGEVSAADRFRLVTLLWSAKESALKALGEGLRLDTRYVAINPVRRLQPPDYPESWGPLEARCEEARMFQGWWQQTGRFVRTVIAAPRPDPPILLRP
jgi:4'-phosphopantetheinyl transferase